MSVLENFFAAEGNWFKKLDRHLRFTVVMVVSVTWLVLGITLSTWLWAYLLLLLGVFNTLEPALYFAISSFTTLGYGDMLLGSDWRILGALSAVNGLIIFGLNTAFLIELIWQSRRKSLHSR